jgi:hypothetical protein
VTVGTIWHATNDSVQEGIRAGIIGPLDEGAVAVLLQMAERLDHPDFPLIDEKFDNVTQGQYLRACEQLGLTPAGRTKLGEKKDAGGGKLAQLRSVQGGAKPKAPARKRA